MSGNTKRDVILVASVLLAAAALFCALRFSRGKGGAVSITVNGEDFGTYPLSEDADIDVKGLLTVSVRDGKAYVSSSTCRGKTCVHERPVSRSGETIVCLPNGVVVRILGESEVDFRI